MNRITRRGRGTFARLSWSGHGRYVQSLTLPNDWQAPCFYLCRKKKIDLATAGVVYRNLLRSGFVSLYSTSSPTEDFAETVVYYLMSKQPGFSFEINLGRSKILDLTSIRRNETLRRKLEFVEAALTDPRTAPVIDGP